MTSITDKIIAHIEDYDTTDDSKERLNILTRCIMLCQLELNQLTNEKIDEAMTQDVSAFDNETLTPKQAEIVNEAKQLNRESIEINEKIAKLQYENIEGCKANLAGFEEMKRRLEKHIAKSA
jgi:hypothetical protein